MVLFCQAAKKRARNNEVTVLPRWPSGQGSTELKFSDFRQVFQLIIMDFACKDIRGGSHTARADTPQK